MDKQGILIVDNSIINRLIEEVRTLKPRLLIEMDVGFGGITERLARTAEKVVGVEKDRRLFETAKKRLKSHGNVDLIHGDILVMNLPSDAVLSKIDDRRLMDNALIQGDCYLEAF